MLESDDEITLKDIILKIQEWWTMLWRQRLLIICFSLITGLLAAFYTKFIAMPTYSASYELIFQEKSGGMSGAMRLASTFGFSLGGNGGGSTSSITVRKYLDSRDNISNALVTELDNGLLVNRYYSNALKKDKEFAEDFVTKFGNNQRYTDSVISRITLDLNTSHINTSLDKKTGHVNFVLTGKNESFVFDLSKILILNTEETFVNYYKAQSQAAVNSFQSKVDSLELVMDATLRRLGEYQDQNNSLVSSVDKMKSMRLTIDLEVLKLSYGEYIKGLEMSKAELINLQPPFKYFDAPTYPLKKDKNSAVKSGLTVSVITGILLVLIFIGRLEVGKIMSKDLVQH